jgi:hypothetical protein
MSAVSAQVQEKGGPKLDLTIRGYQVMFRPDESNHCPSCSRAHWYVGRLTAECVFCGTALPLAGAHWYESGSTPQRFAPIAPVDPSERRRYQRKQADGRVLKLSIDGETHSLTVHDISVGGLKADAPPGLAGAKSVDVVFEGGRKVPAKLCWSEDGLIGLSFTGPVLIDLTRPEQGR